MNDSQTNVVRESFNNLKDFTLNLDPVKLLTDLISKHLLVKSSVALKDGDPQVQWSIYLEFLAGLLLANNKSSLPETEPTEEDLQEIEKKLVDYFYALDKYLATLESNDSREFLLLQSKVYSLHVRGESFPSKILHCAKNFYSEHNEWFDKKLGFTIDDALIFFEAIKSAYSLNATMAANLPQELYESPNKPIDSRKLFLFEIEHLSALSGLSVKKTQAFLNRMSQDFGYENSKHKNTFQDGLKAAWDFNALYDRPIIKTDKKYFVPILSIMPVSLLHSFYFDLINDKEYIEFSNKAGKSLEKMTADCLRRIFKDEDVFENVFYDYNNNREEIDVLLKFDRELIIFQCKLKRVTQKSKIGESEEAFSSDMREGIAAPLYQCKKASDYIGSTEKLRFYNDKCELKLSSKDFDKVSLVNIIFGDYLGHNIQVERINDAFNLWEYDCKAWTVPFLDFDTVTEILDQGYLFLHYLTRRIKSEAINSKLLAKDEIQLLDFYLTQGLWLEMEKVKGVDLIVLGGEAEKIENYMHQKYTLGEKVKKLSRNHQQVLMKL